MTARHNGLADWYDARFVVGAPRHLPSLPELLGPGSGPCLDLGCGTGRNFDTVIAMWISTDLDDFTGALGEAVRVLRTGGRLVCYGVHPSFNGPHVEWNEDGSRLVHPSYRTAGWHDPKPWWGDDGIRRQVGMRHVPLPELLNAFLRPELTVEHIEEPGDMPIPHALAIKARRT